MFGIESLRQVLPGSTMFVLESRCSSLSLTTSNENFFKTSVELFEREINACSSSPAIVCTSVAIRYRATSLEETTKIFFLGTIIELSAGISPSPVDDVSLARELCPLPLLLRILDEEFLLFRDFVYPLRELLRVDV